MASKTKAELMDELKIKNDEIKALNEEIKKLDRYKTYQDSADELAAVRLSYINAGFSESEAFELTKMMMQIAGVAITPAFKRR